MIDSTEWDTRGVTAVRKRAVAIENLEDLTALLEPDAEDGVESEWYAAAEETFDTAPVLLPPRGIQQRTLVGSMMIAALVTATVVCVAFRSRGPVTPTPAVVAAPVPEARPVITPLPPAPPPAPAPIAAHQATSKPTHVAKSPKRRKIAASSGWTEGFAR